MVILKNIDDIESREKLESLVLSIGTCLLSPKYHGFPAVRPSGKIKVDEQGDYWLLCSKRNYTGAKMIDNSPVELIFSEPGQAHVLTIYGILKMAHDKNKMNQLWNTETRQQLMLEKNDPELVLLLISPTEAFFTDNQTGQMVALVKLAKAA